MSNEQHDATIDPLVAIMAARLVALIDRAGSSVRSVSLQLGRPAHDLHRRVQLRGNDRRPLRWFDISEVLVCLGLDVDAILAPVLVGPDARILAWIREHDGTTTAQIVDVFDDGAASLARLQVQRLVRAELDAADVFKITDAGVRSLGGV